MKKITAVFAIVFAVFIIIGFAECTYVRQGEKVFAYDVSSGEAVNEKDNPLLPIGVETAWGWNAKFFSVNGLINDYEFGEKGKGSSPYDEKMHWNSSEGVIMSASYKLYGHVTNPWEFYVHFGEEDYEYKGIQATDIRVYEALRQAGKYIDLRLNELAANSHAEVIRTTPGKMKDDLLREVKVYMGQFGFEITDMLFVGNFEYPDGNVIVDARKKITDLDSEVRQLEQERDNKTNQAKINVQEANNEALEKIGAAKREASMILAESNALAAALKQSIDKIGIEPTLRLKMVELFGELTTTGAMPTVVLTEKSIFAAPFYPAPSTGSGTFVSQPSSSPASKQSPVADSPVVLEKQ